MSASQAHTAYNEPAYMSEPNTLQTATKQHPRAAADSELFKRGVMWFSNDLRVRDNAALTKAAQRCEQLSCIFVVDPEWFHEPRYVKSFGGASMGAQRWRFLLESLKDLHLSLAAMGQQLVVLYARPVDALARWIGRHDVDAVFRSQNAGVYEKHDWQKLTSRYPFIHFKEVVTHTIFTQQQLPFPLDDFPSSFSKFRKKVEPLGQIAEPNEVDLLPRSFAGSTFWDSVPELDPELPESNFTGGETSAREHLGAYFSSSLPSSYKEVRNALDGWENSTKFSPWLAHGCLSVHDILRELSNYEQEKGVNDSTYWIRFELLWREYFQWLAHAHGKSLFSVGGLQHKNTLTSYYAERFKRWCEGRTPFPIVNACMKQLNATGFMSNRGRQLVASCFVNELQLDWRYGAAYFERQLVDYDVASNWGNWQYLAGVGTDPRGKRHFDLAKQTQLYDPEKHFINAWNGDNERLSIDSVDAADWPLMGDDLAK